MMPRCLPGYTASLLLEIWSTLSAPWPGTTNLARLIDLPPTFGGIGLQSLERSADEKFLGSFADISTSLISFCSSTELLVYVAIVEALEKLWDVEGLLNGGDDDSTPLSILQAGEDTARSMSLSLSPPRQILLSLSLHSS